MIYIYIYIYICYICDIYIMIYIYDIYIYIYIYDIYMYICIGCIGKGIHCYTMIYIATQRYTLLHNDTHT